MFSWFTKTSQETPPPLSVDMHSHLLPGIDDGVKTLEESIAVIAQFKKLGYNKLITTPHIMQDAFRNTPELIRQKLTEVQAALLQNNIEIQITAAAEYYLDEVFVQRLNNNEELLTISNKYLLFETNFLTEPLNLKDFIFLASTKGYRLILAHPERYLYLHNNLAKVEDLIDRDVLFQLNISSLTGHYSKPAQILARKLIERGWVHWLASDCHHIGHLTLLQKTWKDKYFQKALTLPLLNNSL